LVGDPVAASGFQPTHRVGGAPLPTYATPHAASLNAAPLDPHLEVRVLEQRPDGWAQVACSNGWTTWVDGRWLQPSRSPGATVAQQAVPFSMTLPLIGCACIVVGVLLPWYRFPVGHLTGWRLPVRFLVARTPGFTEPRAAVLLLPGAVLAAVGTFQAAAGSLREGRLLMLIGATIATNLGMFGVMRWLHPATGLGLSIGAPLTIAGGALVMVALWQTRDRAKEGPWGWL
jgi:hypothetical protein